MTDFKFGDVVLVPFPFSDQTSAKKRPAVVVSSPAYHQSRPDLILMAITSQASLSPRLGEVIIHDWQAAGLLKASLIKPVLTTIERSLVIKTLGQLSIADTQALTRSMARILGPT
jgi:mRNA interferase MazF